MKSLVGRYLLFCGVFSHLVVIFVLIWQPVLIEKVSQKISNKFYQYQKENAYNRLTNNQQLSVVEEIELAFLPWKPLTLKNQQSSVTLVNQKPFSSLKLAVNNLKDGDTLSIAEGIYQTPLVINKNNITIRGNGHVIFERAAAKGKGLILSQGNNLTVENIECRQIRVRDGNGACIRLEGKNLTLRHVYFHRSQEGVLETSKEVGVITIYDSRFELLGHNGQSHGIYTNKADLYLFQSLVIASKNEGHGIKVRGRKLVVESSIIASLSSKDSRLIDMSNGGELTVKNSILEQGPKSANGQMIGFGLEGLSYQYNSINLSGNIIYLDRLGINQLLALPEKNELNISVVQHQNIVIGAPKINESNNIYVEEREAFNLPQYPYFPLSFCDDFNTCFIAHP